MDGLHSGQVRTLIRWIKEGPAGVVPISRPDESLGSLQAVTWDDAGNSTVIELLVGWHRSLLAVFAFQMPMSAGGVRRWLMEQVLEAPERLLFWVRDIAGHMVGHVGLSRFDFAERTVAVRDVVCGVGGAEAILAEAVETLKTWVREAFSLRAVDEGQGRAVA
jgi:hypothetical protein